MRADVPLQHDLAARKDLTGKDLTGETAAMSSGETWFQVLLIAFPVAVLALINEWDRRGRARS